MTLSAAILPIYKATQLSVYRNTFIYANSWIVFFLKVEEDTIYIVANLINLK